MTSIREYIEIINEADQDAIDAQHAERYWKAHPGHEQNAGENLEHVIKKNGYIPVFVTLNGLAERDKDKMAAYRQLAKKLGYHVGPYKRGPSGDIMVAQASKGDTTSYASQYWQANKGKEQEIKDNITKSVSSMKIKLSVSKGGKLSEQDKQKLAAYRDMAHQMGLAIGQYAQEQDGVYSARLSKG